MRWELIARVTAEGLISVSNFRNFPFKKFSLISLLFYSIKKLHFFKENARYILDITIRKVFSYTKIYSFLSRYDTRNDA